MIADRDHRHTEKVRAWGRFSERRSGLVSLVRKHYISSGGRKHNNSQGSTNNKTSQPGEKQAMEPF